jgi:ADP-heptose:LPS heptosyltransferase
MFQHLQIPYRNERWLVGLADAGLRAASVFSGPFRSTTAAAPLPRRILLLRLERVGDLVMVLDAIATVRQLAPGARIDLIVGSWNAALARLIPSIDSVEMLDVPWMARERGGLTWPALIRHARGWRERHYDLGINFEPDIRSNLLLALSGATQRVGFVSGGGGTLLSHGVVPDPAAHIAENAATLAARAFQSIGDRSSSIVDRPSSIVDQRTLLKIPQEARRRAAELMGWPSPGEVTIGIQPAAGRQIKEWDPARFAEVGAALARHRGAKVVLIGSVADRPVLNLTRASWPPDVPLTELPAEIDLIVLAAVLEQLTLFITGDTGPMHLAAAVGTPVLAIFGPSLPTRYAPLSRRSRIVRIDIPCSPCNLMRRPPQRCVGHVPDCLAGIEATQVLKAANEMLDESGSAPDVALRAPRHDG